MPRGATPLADNAEVLGILPEALVREFAERKVRYVRNFGGGVGVSWQKSFGTSSPEHLEELCREHGSTLAWGADGALRVEHVAQAVAEHPASGTRLWFNQAHLFHHTALGGQLVADVKAALSGALPSDSTFGDGGPITDRALEQVRAAFEQCKVRFSWQRGDLLLVDNMRLSHGRDPFVGPRSILGTARGSRR